MFIHIGVYNSSQRLNKTHILTWSWHDELQEVVHVLAVRILQAHPMMAGVHSTQTSEEYFQQCHQGYQLVCREAVLPCVEKVITRWHAQMKTSLPPCQKSPKCTAYPPTDCQDCIDLILAIKSARWLAGGSSPQLTWSYCIPTEAYDDPVEVAKIFCSRLPHARLNLIKSFSDFDCASLLQVLMGFGECHNESLENYSIIKEVQYDWKLLTILHVSS